MSTFGGPDAGFAVNTDDALRIVRIRAWGFWDARVATAFEKGIIEACRTAGARTTIAIDAMQLKPQREEGQAAFVAVMNGLKTFGIPRIEIATTPLTKLQLLRIAKATLPHGVVRFVDAPAT